MSRIIHTVRYINKSPIPRLDRVNLSSGSTGTDHTHANKPFLDDLNIDLEDRLLYENEVLPIPVIEDTW